MRREVYLVRHGHCERSGTLLGQMDVPLTAEGMAQARVLAGQFKTLPVDRILSSDLRRAVQTATCIAEKLNLPVETDSRLREISYGKWDGSFWDEMDAPDPQAETLSAFAARVAGAWEAIRSSAAVVTVVVAHSGVNWLLAAVPELRQDYGSTFKISLP